MSFAIVPEFPILVDSWFSPKISARNHVTLYWIDAALFTAEDELQMSLSGASDELRQFLRWKPEGARLASIDVDELRLKISIGLHVEIRIRFLVLTLMSFDLLI